MSNEGKRCVIYSRVSTEMQVDGFSLAGQRNVLKKFVDREEMILVGEYEDAGKSGKSIEGRPAFKRMLEEIREGLEIDYVVVYKLSRFGRNAADVLNSLEIIQSFGVNLICTEEGINSSNTSGRLLISVLSAVAEIERENIIEQTMNGRREKARQGKWNGGFAPYGYKLVNGKLEIAEDEADAIKIIFQKFLEGKRFGPGRIAIYLNTQGIKKKVRQNGSLDMFSAHTVKQILTNPVYCGMIAYGRRKTEKIKGTRDQYHLVKSNDYILVDGEHEPIISKEIWYQAKEKQDSTFNFNPRKNLKGNNALTGLVKCPICGGPMFSYKSSYTKTNGEDEEYYYFHCRRIKKDTGHHSHEDVKYNSAFVEAYVISAIKYCISNEMFVEQIKDKIGCKLNVDSLIKEKTNYKKRLSEVMESKSRIESSIDYMPLDDKYRDRKLVDLNKRLDEQYEIIDEIEKAIEDCNLKIKSAEMKTITEDNIYKILKNFMLLYNKLTTLEKNTLLKSLIKEIHLNMPDQEYPIKSIIFNFPIFRKGTKIEDLTACDKEELCATFKNNQIISTIDLIMNFGYEDNQISPDLMIANTILPTKPLKGTYPEIKKYIMDKYNKKVSSGYIAYVKRQFCSNMRLNYNISKKGTKPKLPTKETQEFIKEALRYFKVID